MHYSLELGKRNRIFTDKRAGRVQRNRKTVNLFDNIFKGFSFGGIVDFDF
ncbi:MAG: hypothetical protein WA584_03210 [Pyrinomonadaceae bacterium]